MGVIAGTVAADAGVGLGPRTLGEALRMLRHRARVSRDELAAAARASAGTISNYENDVSTPSAPTLRRVVYALAPLVAVDPADLWEQLGQIMDGQLSDSSSHRS